MWRQDVCAGIIGELGCSHPLLDGERKTLQAAALAQRVTGAAVQVHPGRDATSPMAILRELQAAGADLSRVVMCHVRPTHTCPWHTYTSQQRLIRVSIYAADGSHHLHDRGCSGDRAHRLLHGV